MLFVYLAVFAPIVLGLGLLCVPFNSEKARKTVYSVILFGTTILTWSALLSVDGSTIPLLQFTDNLTLSFRLDGAARLFAGLSATLWPFTTVYAYDYMRHEEHLSLFWAFFTAAFGITLGIAFAANALTMYVFYELLTLATIPLVMHALTPKAIKAGIKYMTYSMSGAALGFIALIYLIVNDAADFVYGGHIVSTDTLGLVVFTLGFIGFGVKAAIWPLHSWLPAAAVAPTPVTALLHAVAVVKAGAFACIRLVYFAFGTEALVGTWAQYTVMALAVITLVYGSATALRQNHFKRRLAFSTVSNLSYILFAAAIMTQAGLIAAFMHLLVHSVVKIMAFFCAGSVLHYAHREQVDELEGLGRHMPITFFCFTVAACALTGVPPFNGFVSKWYLGLAAVQSGDIAALLGFIGILLSALLTAIYMFGPVIKAYFPSKDTLPIPEDTAHEASPLMWVPMVILAVACVVMGLFPQVLLDMIGKVVL